MSFDNPAIAELANRVVAGARNLWGNGRDLSRVLLTGGGAEYVQDHVRAAYPHTQVVRQPHLGNVRGYLKYATRRFS